MPRTGPKAAKVTIAEFSDFQCPFCKRVEPTVKEILQKYPNDVAVVFINQPLPFHEHAMEAAQAFQAAHRQGKAWPMHDKMYDNNTALERANLEKYAQEIGLNVAKFKKDMDDPKIKEEIAEHQKLATSVGANGTPTFFINGRQLVGAQPFAEFQKIIDEEIKKADELVKKGTPLKDVYQKLMEQAAATPPPAPPGGAPEAPAAKVDIKIGDAPVKGPASAKVTVIEFSDFQCPFCGAREPDAEGDRGRSTRARSRSPSATCRCRSTTRRTWPPRRRWPPTSRASSGRCTTSCSPTSRRSTARRSKSTPRSWA